MTSPAGTSARKSSGDPPAGGTSVGASAPTYQLLEHLLQLALLEKLPPPWNDRLHQPRVEVNPNAIELRGQLRTTDIEGEGALELQVEPSLQVSPQGRGAKHTSERSARLRLNVKRWPQRMPQPWLAGMLGAAALDLHLPKPEANRGRSIAPTPSSTEATTPLSTTPLLTLLSWLIDWGWQQYGPQKLPLGMQLSHFQVTTQGLALRIQPGGLQLQLQIEETNLTKTRTSLQWQGRAPLRWLNQGPAASLFGGLTGSLQGLLSKHSRGVLQLEGESLWIDHRALLDLLRSA